jgi:hypothetical protein
MADFELLDPHFLDAWDVEKRTDYKKAVHIVENISKDNIDITDKWGSKVFENLSFCLAYFGEQGRHLWKTIASCNSEYSEKAADEQFEKALSLKKPFTGIAVLIKHAKFHGVDVKPPKIVGEGKSLENDPTNFLPEGANVEDYKQYGFWEQNDQYWGVSQRGDIKSVSNFVMKILYHVQTSGESARRMIEIKNIYGYSSVINMNTDDFVSTTTFKKVIARFGNYIFKGSDIHLVNLQDKLQREERKTLMVETLGWNTRAGAYIFANGLWCNKKNEFIMVDEYGIVDYNGHSYFIPYCSKMYADKDDQFMNEKKFMYMVQEDYCFSDWCNDLHRIYKDKSWILMTFYVAALFSDIIYKEIGSRFPMLNVFGPRGSGKGTYVEKAMAMFGEKQAQIMLEGPSTTKGFMRKLGSFTNAIIWLDEYKNNLKRDAIGAIKNIYDRTGYTRGMKTNNLETETTPIRSAVILSGQDLPNIEPALFSRFIVVIMDDLGDIPESEKTFFNDFRKREEKGLSFITAYLQRLRQTIKDEFRGIWETESLWLANQTKDSKTLERYPNNYAVLSTIASILLQHERNLPFTLDDFRSTILTMMVNHVFLTAGSDDLNKFWNVVEQLFMQGKIIEGIDFDIVREESINVLHVRLNNIHGLYKERLRSQGEEFSLDLETMRNYLKRDPSIYLKEFCEGKKRVFSGGTYTSSMAFDYSRLDITLTKSDPLAGKPAGDKPLSNEPF